MEDAGVLNANDTLRSPHGGGIRVPFYSMSGPIQSIGGVVERSENQLRERGRKAFHMTRPRRIDQT